MVDQSKFLINMTDEEKVEILERMEEIKAWKGKIVRHFKGDDYLILSITEHTETGELMVNYKALYGECLEYSRPLWMFAGRVTIEQEYKYGIEYRMTPITYPSIKDSDVKC